jgi:hypothetical protein
LRHSGQKPSITRAAIVPNGTFDDGVVDWRDCLRPYLVQLVPQSRRGSYPNTPLIRLFRAWIPTLGPASTILSAEERLALHKSEQLCVATTTSRHKINGLARNVASKMRILDLLNQ